MGQGVLNKYGVHLHLYLIPVRICPQLPTKFSLFCENCSNALRQRQIQTILFIFL